MSESTITGLAPSDRQAIYEELAQEFSERLDQSVLSALDNGFLFFAPAKPRDRLQWYIGNTLVNDLHLVLDESYLRERKAGTAPLLEAERMAQAHQQAVAADPNSASQLPPMFWPLVLPPSLPSVVFERASADFRRLWRAYGRGAPPENQQTEGNE